MRNKYDFENIVYEKADALSEKERRYYGYRKAVLSTAAVFAVLTAAAVGSFFSISSEPDSIGYSAMAENDAVQNGAAAEKALNEDAAAQNDDRYSEDIYNYTNGLNEEDYDGYDDEFVGDENKFPAHSEIDKTDIADNSYAADRVVYECKDKSIVIADEEVFNDFLTAVKNLEENKTLIDSEESLFEIDIIENNGNDGEYVTKILVYGGVLEITHGEYDTGNQSAGTYNISDEFITLVRENFDEHFMDD